MPRITALRLQSRAGDRVSLYLDDEFAFDLPRICAVGLQTGQALSEDEVQALDDKRKRNAAYDRAVNYLSFRPRSAEEVRRHLAKAGFPQAIAEDVLQRLRQQGTVDDGSFARFWIENRERFKPIAPRALRHELSQKGVGADIIEPLLDAIDVEASAERAAKKRVWRYKGKSRNEFRRKLGDWLYRRGFDSDTIYSVIDRLQAELEQTDARYFADSLE